ACATPAGIWSSCGIVVERALDNPPPLSRWLLGALALTGWPVFAPETGAPTKGGGVGCRRSTRPGCEQGLPGRDEHQLVRGPSGLAPPRSTIRLPHCAGSCCSRGSVWASVLLSRMALARF